MFLNRMLSERFRHDCTVEKLKIYSNSFYSGFFIVTVLGAGCLLLNFYSMRDCRKQRNCKMLAIDFTKIQLLSH